MGITYQGSGDGGSGSTTVVVTEATSAGDTLLVFTSGTSFPTDTSANTYVQLETPGIGQLNAYGCLSTKAAGAGTNTITCLGTASGRALYWHARGVISFDSSQRNFSNGTGTAPNPGNITPSNTGETLVAATVHTAGINTEGSGYALRIGTTIASIQDQIGAGSGSQSTAFVGSSTSWKAVAVTLFATTIAATSTVTFDETGSLTGSGAIGGTSTVTFGETGNLGGIGALAASSTVTFDETGNVTGAGTLAASSTVTFDETGNVTGAGALAATSTVTFDETGNLTGAGTLTATSTVTFDETASLVGTGALDATSTVTFDETGSLTGAGELDATSTVTFDETGSLAGGGELDASSTVTFDETGSLTGAGELDATSTITFDETASLAGAGELDATSTVTFDETGSLTGAGALIATSTVTFDETADILGQGFITGFSTVTFDAVGTLLQPSSPLAGTSTVTFDATGTLIGIQPSPVRAHKPIITSGAYTLRQKTAEYVPDYETPEFDPERYAYLDDWGQPGYNTGVVTFGVFEEKIVRDRRKESGLLKFRDEVRRIAWRKEQAERREIIVITSTGVAYIVLKWLITP